jgi:hypothetical protein
MRMNWDEIFGWTLAALVGLCLFRGMRAGWSPRHGYNVARTGLMAIPIVLKAAHSVSHWLQRRASS